MSETWERGEHPAQAEVHESIEPEFEIDEYLDHNFVVQISVRESVGCPTEDEIRKAIYRGVSGIDTEDAVYVTHAP